MYFTEHLPADNVHWAGLNEPAPVVTVHATVPAGWVGVPPPVSVTVAVHVAGAPTGSVLPQLATVVVVLCTFCTHVVEVLG